MSEKKVKAEGQGQEHPTWDDIWRDYWKSSTPKSKIKFADNDAEYKRYLLREMKFMRAELMRFLAAVDVISSHRYENFDNTIKLRAAVGVMNARMLEVFEDFKMPEWH